MSIVIRLLLCVVSLVASAAAASAQKPTASPSASAGDSRENIDWSSPDEKFAFLTAYGDDLHTLDLIDRNSKKPLQRIGEEDSSQTYWHLLWAPDSNRFALMTRSGHPIQGVDVYFRSADTFRKVVLPDLPEANVPESLKRGKKFPHFASLNWRKRKSGGRMARWS